MSDKLVPQPVESSILEKLKKDLKLVVAWDENGDAYAWYPNTKTCEGIDCFVLEGEPGKTVSVPQMPGHDKVFAAIAGFATQPIWLTEAAEDDHPRPGQQGATDSAD